MGVGAWPAGSRAHTNVRRLEAAPGPLALPFHRLSMHLSHNWCAPSLAVGTEHTDKTEYPETQGLRRSPSLGREGKSHSPRNCCTALTAWPSSTTSEMMSSSCVHARALAATVLAPRLLATLWERAGGAGRAGVWGRAGDSLGLRPHGPSPLSLRPPSHPAMD